MRGSLNHACRTLDLIQSDIGGTDDGQDNTVCAVDGGLEQRRLDCLLCRFLCLVLADCGADAHVCVARTLHNGSDVREVQVDQTRNGDQLGNRSDCLMQDVVCDFECVLEADLLLGDVLQSLIRDNDQGIDVLLERLDAGVCLLHALLALECERTSDNADRQDAHLARDLCDNRSTAGAGTAAHACGDEYHVRTLECLGDLLAAFLSGLASGLRLGARALALGQLCADLNLDRSLRAIQRLLIGIDCNKLQSLQAGSNHVIDGVVAATADTNYFDVDNGIVIHFKFETHFLSPPSYVI